jgi:uncharacterized protein YbjT (DUF2867 family)
VSIIDAAPDHPLELWRMKYQAEQELKASGLSWTIISSAPFMEWALAQYGDPLIRTGRTWIFGRGRCQSTSFPQTTSPALLNWR